MLPSANISALLLAILISGYAGQARASEITPVTDGCTVLLPVGGEWVLSYNFGHPIKIFDPDAGIAKNKKEDSGSLVFRMGDFKLEDTIIPITDIAYGLADPQKGRGYIVLSSVNIPPRAYQATIMFVHVNGKVETINFYIVGSAAGKRPKPWSGHSKLKRPNPGAQSKRVATPFPGSQAGFIRIIADVTDRRDRWAI